MIIPSDIDQFYYVIEISLSHGILRKLPNELFNLDLHRLNIHRNKIKSIPQEIKNLKNLIFFDISNNYIGIIPKEIWMLTKLQMIGLNYNYFMNTPSTDKPSIRLAALQDCGIII